MIKSAPYFVVYSGKTGESMLFEFKLLSRFHLPVYKNKGA
jgi:hypothetical protein